jgi:ATP-dependent helicase HrpB
MSSSYLPINDVLSDIEEELARRNNLIIAAPPGAGKTTVVPLKILESSWYEGGKIILIEPRRLAARSAAHRMAVLHGDDVGQTIGYRMRLDTKISDKTRIEVVTEGVFTRMVLDDPELSGIECVIFDEFHERSLDADFGLALTLDVQAGLREDLKILVMSATLDIEEINRILPDAGTIISEGRTFPIDIRYQPRRANDRIEDVMVDAIANILASEEGSILCFLPGQGEIKRVYDRLENRIGDGVECHMLFGSMPMKDQDAAIQPIKGTGRKVVLATSIAETSITIDGVRIVIDSGLRREAFFEAVTGITRLETIKASQAATTQRAGRAGRTEPGIALRLWQKEQQAALPKFTAPEILSSDLSTLMLDCLSWGVSDLHQLAFLTEPPSSAVEAALALLRKIGAIDQKANLTELGKSIRLLPLSVRLAAMVIDAAKRGQALLAAKLSVLLSEQGLGGNDIDIEHRLQRLEHDRSKRAVSSRKLAERIARMAEQSAKTLPRYDARSVGGLLATAFPDRIAKQRSKDGQFTMANGRGAVIDHMNKLASEPMLIIADLTGRAAAPRVLSACRFDMAELDDLPHGVLQEAEECYFDRQSQSVRARYQKRLGAIILQEKQLSKPEGAAAAEALADGISQVGIKKLHFSKSLHQWIDRSEYLRLNYDENWPNLSDEGLIGSLDQWFLPFQTDVLSIKNISAQSLENGIKTLLNWDQARQLDDMVPTHFKLENGKSAIIEYRNEGPAISLRAQQFFGQKHHPSILNGKVPLLVELLSPAQRPIQLTRDLPGFWKGSWSDVCSDMRGRYPKHDWPDDPANAKPPVKRQR